MAWRNAASAEFSIPKASLCFAAMEGMRRRRRRCQLYGRYFVSEIRQSLDAQIRG
jgi:hypothetical protein